MGLAVELPKGQVKTKGYAGTPGKWGWEWGWGYPNLNPLCPLPSSWPPFSPSKFPFSPLQTPHFRLPSLDTTLTPILSGGS